MLIHEQMQSWCGEGYGVFLKIESVQCITSHHISHSYFERSLPLNCLQTLLAFIIFFLQASMLLRHNCNVTIWLITKLCCYKKIWTTWYNIWPVYGHLVLTRIKLGLQLSPIVHSLSTLIQPTDDIYRANFHNVEFDRALAVWLAFELLIAPRMSQSRYVAGKHNTDRHICTN